MVIYRQVLDIHPGTRIATDIYALHQAVMTGWRHVHDEPSQRRARQDILFATNRGPSTIPDLAGPVKQVLVQATTPPDWTDSHFAPQFMPHAPAFAYTPPPLAPGDHVGVHVTFHATRTINDRKRPLTKADDILDWATKTFADAATLHHDTSVVVPEGYTKGHRATHIPFTTLTTTATITNPDALTGHLTHGIGRAKAFGGGLIRIRPLP